MNFVHSLKHLSLVQVAVVIYRSPEVWQCETAVPCYHFNSKWEPFVREKIHRYIPSRMIQDIIISAFNPLEQEVFEWRLNHAFIEGPPHNANLFKIRWKCEGTVDRLETAKRLIHDEEFSLPERFLLACYYSLKDEVIELWGKLKPSDHKEVFRMVRAQSWKYGDRANLEQDFDTWITWLKQGAKRKEYADVEIMIASNINVPPPADVWKMLTTEFKMNQSRLILEKHSHRSYGRDYLSKLNNTEQIEVFKRDCFRALRIFLDWPFQDRFLEMAERLRADLTKDDYLLLFLVIVQRKINRHFTDFDYVGLLNKLWLQSSPETKEYARSDSGFHIIRKYISQSI